MLRAIYGKFQNISLAAILFALFVFSWLSTRIALHEQLPYGFIWAHIHYAGSYYFLEAAALAFLLKRLGVNTLMIVLVLIATLPQVHFLFKTGPYQYAPDAGGHMNYIAALVINNYIPPIPAGWQYQQPFLYYEWGAIAHTIGMWLGVYDQWLPARIASRILYIGYVVFSILLINKLPLRFLVKLAAASVVIFWPGAYMVSVRINSDIGFYFFFMGALYFLHDWYQNLSTKSLAIAVSSAALSLLCKATGVMSLVMVACVVLHVWLRRRVTIYYFFNRWALLSVSITILCFLGYFGRIAYYNWFYDAGLEWFANVKMHEVIAMNPLVLKDMFSIKVLDFITIPGFEWNKYDSGQYSFWGGLWRTLMYDDSDLIQPRTLLMVIHAMWFGIICMLLMQIVYSIRGISPHGYTIFCYALLTIIIISIIQRAQIPDWRLLLGRRIYPIIPIIMIMVAAFIQLQYDKGRKYIYLMSALICILFSAASYALLTYRVHQLTSLQ